MYMNKQNIIDALDNTIDMLKSADFEDIDQAVSTLKQVRHQLETYKCFIDVRDEHPLGQDEEDKTMKVDSPFNDGNPVNTPYSPTMKRVEDD